MTSEETVRDQSLTAFQNAFEDFLESERGWVALERGAELSWLRDWRSLAASRWLKTGLPTRQSEEWRYTNLKALENIEIDVAEEVLSADQRQEIQQLRSQFPQVKCLKSGAIEIAFLNGVFVPEWSSLSLQDQTGNGLSVTVFSQLMSQCRDEGWSAERREKIARIRSLLSSQNLEDGNPFSAMNASFMHECVYIEVAQKTSPSLPIVIWNFANSGADSRLEMGSPRVLLHAGASSSVVVAEVSVSVGRGQYFMNSMTDFVLEEGARLSHLRYGRGGEKHLHIGTTRIRQQKNSFCETYDISAGGAVQRQNLDVLLQGEAAEAVLDGLYLASGEEQVDHFTSVEHQTPHTTSSQLYKGILDDQARGVFRGRVRIYPGALKSSAAQLNKNLLLSRKAEIDTRPELEIDADDVKASHGATVGRIDPEQVFYLQARGIKKAEAERILARGFGLDIALRIREPKLRNLACELLGQLPRFHSLESGGSDV